MLKSLVFALSLALVPCFSAHADQYPSRAIKIVVPYAPGGGLDTTARLLGEQLSARLKQPVIVENRPGAGGAIGTAAVAQSPPNGYTLLLGNPGPNVIAPYVNPAVKYDPISDFAPVSLVSYVPFFLVVPAESRAQSVGDLVKLGKAAGARLSFSSPGYGASSHIAAELFNREAGTNYLHVPLKGAALQVTELLANRTDFAFMSSIDVLPHIKQGSIRALAVGGRRRIPDLPNVPTIAEAGLPGATFEVWYGLLAPAKTPKTVIDRLNAVVTESLESPELRRRLMAAGTVPFPSRVSDFEATLKADAEKYSKLVKTAGIKAE